MTAPYKGKIRERGMKISQTRKMPIVQKEIKKEGLEYPKHRNPLNTYIGNKVQIGLGGYAKNKWK